MKPRISKEHSITMRCKMWFCRGNGSLGIGDTPKYAYYDWLWREKQKGEA